MKKSPVKEVLIGTIATAVAGYVIKKALDFYKEEPGENFTEKKNSFLEKTKDQVNQVVKKFDNSREDEATMKNGLIATMAYTLTVFGLTKFLRKVW